jgi:rubredoxin
MSEQSSEEVKRELSFYPSSFEQWLHCPECGSRHVAVDFKRVDKDEKGVWYMAAETIWFRCESCGEVSVPEHGHVVEQDEEPSKSPWEKFRRLLADAV